MGLIQDILPPERKEVPRELQVKVDVNYLEHVDTSLLISELYARGVPISRVFGLYYEIEQAYNGRTMTVEDAILAGYDGINFNPKEI